MSHATRIITAPTNIPLRKPYSIIIPSAGYANRMKSYGPCSLFKIKNGLLINHQLKYIYSFLQNVEIILVGGFEFIKLRGTLRNSKIRILENNKWDSTNVVASIDIGLKEASYKDVIILHGNVVYNEEIFKAPFGSYSSIIIDGQAEKDKNKIGCTIDNNRIEHMMYGLPNRWAEMIYLRGDELSLFKEECSNPANHICFAFEMVNRVINSGGEFTPINNKKLEFVDISSTKDFTRAEAIV